MRSTVSAMLDIRRIRTDLEGVTAEMSRRGTPELIEQLVRASELDAESRRINASRDELRAQIRVISNEVGTLFREGHAEEAKELQAESRRLGAKESELDVTAAAVADRLRDLLLHIPNVPHPDAADGTSDADNPVMWQVPAALPEFADHQRVPHWEIGAQLGIIDNERAAKIAGAMFSMLRGAGATMGRALCQLALDSNADAFEEIRPPTLVSTATLTATGQLPKFADDAYHLERDDLWCTPTAEVPLTSIYRDEILAETDLPKRLMAYTPCYRREAGSAGRDTRGLLRSHEFDKVEILALTTPAQAPAMLEELTKRAAAVIEELGLNYRVIDICTGDLGQSHHRSHDIEVYAPGCDQWLEVSSVSWFSDYQARRGNIRFRATDGTGTQVAHTLNGSALAVPRVLASVLETHRQPDGSVMIPECLRPYMRGMTNLSTT